MKSFNNKYLIILITSYFFIKLLIISYFSENINLLNRSDSNNYLEILEVFQKNFFDYFNSSIHTNRLAGYPIFLFLLSFISENIIFFIIVQSILSFYTLFITYKISCLVTNNIKKVLLFFVIFNLPLILYSSLILTESIYIPIFYTFVFFFLKYILYKKNYFFLTSIFFLALSSLIRPTSYYFFFIICIYYFFITEKNLKNILSIFISILILLILNYPFMKKNFQLFKTFDQTTISTTMILDYWLPSIERYQNPLDYNMLKKEIRNDFQIFLNKEKFEDYKNPFSVQKKARLFFFKRLGQNNMIDIFKGFSSGTLKSLFAPTYLAYAYWLNFSYTGFYDSKGTNFISQNINYFFYNSNFLHGVLAFIFSIFTFAIRIISLYGVYKIYKFNKQIFIFFFVVVTFFLLINGSAGGPRHKLPFEFILIIISSITVADFFNLVKMKFKKLK
jgi:hypothetical protein